MPENQNLDLDNTAARGRRARPIVSARRLTLLGSVALLGTTLALSGLHASGQPAIPGLGAAAHAAEATQGPPSFADLVARVKPAVISVRVTMDQTAENAADDGQEMQDLPPSLQGSPFERFFHQRSFGDGQRVMPQQHHVQTGLGSGFFISADGYAVTNNHVVDHAKSVKVTTDDGVTYTAKVIGTDARTDLALIRVDGKNNFAYVNFEDEAPRVGDWVVAVGNPFGLGGTVTAGVISARGRDIGSGPYDDYLQIDAPINKGNSGGPAFDMKGNVVGINTAIYSPSGGSVGIGFDIPAQTAKLVVAQLREKGAVTRGWLGVQIQPVTSEIAESLGLKKAEGALVAEPQPNSPAAKAGLQPGDVITGVNGTAVKDARDLARQIAGQAPGRSVKLDMLRKGQASTVEVALGTIPKEQQANAEIGQSNEAAKDLPRLGLALAPADRVAGAGDKGVVVTGVDPAGPAAERGLKSGDVILQVGGKAVTSVKDVRQALSDAKTAGKHDVLVQVKTSDATRFVAMPIG
jgi:serine protease Do